MTTCGLKTQHRANGKQIGVVCIMFDVIKCRNLVEIFKGV